MVWKIVRRLSLWISTMHLVGASLLTYGLQITERPELLVVGQPVMVLEAKAPWALYFGWRLIVLGFLLQIVSEIVTAIRSSPE